MSLDPDGIRTRRTARGLAVVPVVFVLLTGHPVVSADPNTDTWPPLGEIVTGSASSGTGSDNAGPDGIVTGSASVGGELSLEPAPVGGSVHSGSAGQGGAGTEAAGSGIEPAAGVELALPEPATAPPVAENPLAPPDLDSDTVRTACAGSAVVGLSLIVAGILTGSGHALGSSLSGPGSAVGSAAVGSAMTGSGLACLLWPPELPPFPGLPLELTPPAVAGPILPTEFPDILEAPPISPPVPRQQPVTIPPLTQRQAVPPTSDPVAWNMLQLVTVMLVVVIGTVRTGATYIRRHKHE
ncbi:hypothetical protein [Nocardia brasiliensis]|uniref:hypothetical protein n=1 Tax=Nocardia brasiliensis TaxID=37326 RepID=UPI0002527DA4|nr:hypothetical protein [Nocardia brasiliensis]